MSSCVPGRMLFQSMPLSVTFSPAAPKQFDLVTFDATWSRSTHPEDPPDNPHFSPLIGATHRSSVVFWAALLTVPLVGFQGLLGAITVVRELPAEVVATHLLTAMFVLSFELVVAIGMTLADPKRQTASVRRAQDAFRVPGLWAIAAIAWPARTSSPSRTCTDALWP